MADETKSRRPMGMTVASLFLACKRELEAGNGDKVVLLASDDEGNGAHVLFYEFLTGASVDEYLEGAVYQPRGGEDDVYDGSNSVILG